MGTNKLEDWYNIKAGSIQQGMIKKFYGGSLSKALETVISNYNSKFWKFSKIPPQNSEKSKETPRFNE